MQAFYPSILEELEAYSNMNHNISANALNNLKKNMGDKNSSFKSIKSRSSVAKSDQDDSLSGSKKFQNESQKSFDSSSLNMAGDVPRSIYRKSLNNSVWSCKSKSKFSQQTIKSISSDEQGEQDDDEDEDDDGCNECNSDEDEIKDINDENK